jgi:Putative DNA-binding domain
MDWIKVFFGKKKSNYKILAKDVQSFVSKKIEENLHLEYKDIEKIHDIDGLAIAVSSFANADGGLLILGISERQHLPEMITWGSSILSKETLEQKLYSKIQPPITNIRIVPIRDRTQSVIFIISIPRSDMLHQSPDKKYYQRRNFQKLPMEDYQIRDFLGKRRKPNLEISFKETSKKDSDGYKKYQVYISNTGGGLAKYISAIIRFPEEESRIADLKETGASLQRIDHLYDGKRALQFTDNNGVIHPGINTNIGEVRIKLENRKQKFKYSCTICAEDMEKKLTNGTA